MDKKVLIVDDSRTINKVLHTTLQPHFTTYQAYNLQQARDILQAQKIDYMMLDINLPDGSGYELVEELAYKDVKIFVLTTEDDKQFIEMNLQRGVIEFIIKDKAFLDKVKQLPSMIKKLQNNFKKTILVVDDSHFIRVQLCRLFENRNYTVVAVASTNEMLAYIENNKVDLVLLDIELEHDNGIDFLQKHRHFIVDKRKIPVMIISGYIDDVVTKLALKSGAVDVLKKPYVTEEIILKVSFWIEYNHLNDEVGDLKEQYNTLAKQKEGYEILLNVTMEMIFIHNKNFDIIDVNKTALHSLGFVHKKELLAKNLQHFFFNESWSTVCEHVSKKCTQMFEAVLNVEGKKLDVLMRTQAMQIDNQDLYITTMLDISEMKLKEKQLIQQNKFAQLGEMLSMIAHQWRQPLNLISMMNETIRLCLRKNNCDKTEAITLSKDIATQIQYLSKTINDFKEFFMPKKEPVHTTLDHIINGVLDLVESSLKHNRIEVILQLDAKSGIRTYVSEVKQVLINLIRNAEDAIVNNTQGKRFIKIQTYEKKDHIVIKIADNGGGISPDIVKNIFEPYFTTKGDKNGTGLGLYMSKLIVEKHCKGSIEVHNTKDGAEFFIELPKT